MLMKWKQFVSRPEEMVLIIVQNIQNIRQKWNLEIWDLEFDTLAGFSTLAASVFCILAWASHQKTHFFTLASAPKMEVVCNVEVDKHISNFLNESKIAQMSFKKKNTYKELKIQQLEIVENRKETFTEKLLE